MNRQWSINNGYGTVNQSSMKCGIVSIKLRQISHEDGVFMLRVRAGSVHPQSLSVQSRWRVSEASSPGCWVDHQIVNAGLWQQYGSVAGKHHIHADIINAHIVLLTVKGPRCIFLPFPSSNQRGREGEDHPGTVPSRNAPILGREVEKTQGGGSIQRRGWKLCQGRMPRVTRRYEAPLYGVPPCPSHEPSPGPISYFPLWNQTFQSRERKSMVRNNLTVCHRGMLLPTRAKEVCSRVYCVCVCFFESVFVSVSVSVLSVCWHVCTLMC